MYFKRLEHVDKEILVVAIRCVCHLEQGHHFCLCNLVKTVVSKFSDPLALSNHNNIKAFEEANEAENSMSLRHSSDQAILCLLIDHESFHLLWTQSLLTFQDDISKLDVTASVWQLVQLNHVSHVGKLICPDQHEHILALVRKVMCLDKVELAKCMHLWRKGKSSLH